MQRKHAWPMHSPYAYGLASPSLAASGRVGYRAAGLAGGLQPRADPHSSAMSTGSSAPAPEVEHGEEDDEDGWLAGFEEYGGECEEYDEAEFDEDEDSGQVTVTGGDVDWQQ